MKIKILIVSNLKLTKKLICHFQENSVFLYFEIKGCSNYRVRVIDQFYTLT